MSDVDSIIFAAPIASVTQTASLPCPWTTMKPAMIARAAKFVASRSVK
jgi:hypothetical protein